MGIMVRYYAIKLFIIIITFVYIYFFLGLICSKDHDSKIQQLELKVTHLENVVRIHSEELLNISKSASERSSQLESYLYENYFSVKRRKTTLNHSLNEWPYPIPVLVFVCNRALAIKHHLDKLLKYRSSADKFPIIVSQDCDDKLVTNVVKSYGNSVNYIKHLSGEKVNISTAAGHRRYLTYYRIARHYRLGLTYVFDHLKYSSVIITEDDLDIAPDFFNYFSATRYLLDRDPSLFCISAWNDNGKLNLIDKEAAEVLYRSDFFPGLGWMMSSDLWKELGPIWPSGFWDDWIRDPLRRKDRACIRPEISRTGMTKEGQDGASNGLFFNKHLARIAINQYPVDFTAVNLDYLLKENYDKVFLERVYSAEVITTLYLSKTKLLKRNNEYRIEYSTIIDYLFIAEKLQIMRDFKAGVPRTAYFGVVTCFINHVRLFVAPNRTIWKGYDVSWEAPEPAFDILTL